MGWLLSQKAWTINGIGNCSNSNFKCALASELSDPEESIITVSITTADQDRITKLDNNKADKEYAHEISDVTWLVDELECKGLMSHAHIISDITDYTPYDNSEFRNIIDNKADNGNTHEIEDINELVDVLEGKAPLNHTHDLFNYMQYAVEINEYNDEKRPIIVIENVEKIDVLSVHLIVCVILIISIVYLILLIYSMIYIL